MLTPPAVGNAADDAILLYEACGQRLDPWQQTTLRVGLGERADGTWASFENGIICSRQNGKGAPIEALLLASAFLWGNRETVYSAHRGDTARAFFRRVRALIEGNPDLKRRVEPIADSDEDIVLVSGARIEFRTRTRSGGRGLTGDLVILDEALELDPDQVAALVPTLLARPYAQLWYFSTVPTSADAHLVGVRARVEEGAERLAWAEWTCEDDADPSNVEDLAQANPGLGIRITLERLMDLRGILGEAKFKTECMGIWPDTAKGSVLSTKSWRTMVDLQSMRAPGGEVFMSMDCSPEREYGTIGMWAARADGLEHVQLTDYAAGTGWMVERAKQLRDALQPVLWVIDPKNGAFALVDDLAKVGIKVADDPKRLKRGDLLLMTTEDITTSVAQFIDAYRAKPPVFRHLGQEPLTSAVANVKARPIGDAGQIAWARRKSDVNIGPVEVITKARWARIAWLTRQAPVLARSKVW